MYPLKLPHHLKRFKLSGILYLVEWYIVSGMPSFVGLPNSEDVGSMLLQNIGNGLKSMWCDADPSRLTLGPTQPPIQWVLASLPWGAKQPEHGVNHLPPSWPVLGGLYLYLYQ